MLGGWHPQKRQCDQAWARVSLPRPITPATGNGTSVSYRMMLRGGKGSGGTARPSKSSEDETAESGVVNGSSTSAVAGIAAKEPRQKSMHEEALPSSAGGHSSQSSMSASVMTAVDTAADIAVAFCVCTTVPAARSATSTTARRRMSCVIGWHSSPISRDVHIRSVAGHAEPLTGFRDVTLPPNGIERNMTAGGAQRGPMYWRKRPI